MLVGEGGVGRARCFLWGNWGRITVMMGKDHPMPEGWENTLL